MRPHRRVCWATHPTLMAICAGGLLSAAAPPQAPSPDDLNARLNALRQEINALESQAQQEQDRTQAFTDSAGAVVEHCQYGTLRWSGYTPWRSVHASP